MVRRDSVCMGLLMYYHIPYITNKNYSSKHTQTGHTIITARVISLRMATLHQSWGLKPEISPRRVISHRMATLLVAGAET